MGLVIILALALYIAISMGIIAWAVSYAKKQGKSAKRWGWGAALAMYMLVFWDWIPTVVVHKYYCATEAGYWVYKTPEQWKQENLGVMEGLVASKIPVRVSHEGDENSWTDAEMLNQRIKMVSKRNGKLFLHRWRWEGEWIDSQNNEVLARYIDFYTSHERRQAGWSGWKFWLATDHCDGYQEKAIKFSKSIEQFKGSEK
ncbi:MAG: hypothetical protein Q8M99_10040 [Methylotenera sp.]|nr:hypothetical protein [Methylotenera sp.]